MKNSLFLLVLLIILGSCNNDKKNDYATGSVIMATDPSFYNVTDALSYRYMKVYPDAKIELKQMKEKEALKALIDNKVSTIVMSRELTETEKQSFLSNIKLKAVPAYFAADALVFVVPKESSIEKISVDDVAKMLTDEKRTLIFDGANTSNTDYIAERLKIDPAKMQYSSLKSNEEIIENLTKFPGHIGVISLNTISRPYDEKAKELRSKIKILNITDAKGEFAPSRENLRYQKYPFTRILYFLTNEGNFGVGNGFIRYSCSQVGQLIVDKNGLQPYLLYKRMVEIK
ncbi:phosphate ABC transporter substrate-binding protein [Elizabethkingia miricola]|uniref:PstS family phosphate ABC transporter substrate-binding protein n=1 Tax=Elizabethkingia bruuniana TaxID=1756149 RepID=UPI000998F594|nr:substrate-binding domain-containing protein [Elizabethkingia bruuniana]OPC56987.1 phosphate ABC transporter substrate-binding protein [Elizabethkingia bruuniana]OPC59702.1 phosphate ABC transporter substrate-binding protein [Elizabethkingia bruuniana]RBI90399.1 phosphate ABC transporter substrate-binding protein [Elizabethkingia miricola]